MHEDMTWNFQSSAAHPKMCGTLQSAAYFKYTSSVVLVGICGDGEKVEFGDVVLLDRSSPSVVPRFFPSNLCMKSDSVANVFEFSNRGFFEFCENAVRVRAMDRNCECCMGGDDAELCT
jgi:hypothetical protein